MQTLDVKGGRGQAHFVAKCGFCQRECNIEYVDNSLATYSHNEEFQKVAQFDCRGCEIIDFVSYGGFKGKCSVNDNEVTEIDLKDKEWAGYDEEGDCALVILDFKSKIEKAPGGKGK